MIKDFIHIFINIANAALKHETGINDNTNEGVVTMMAGYRVKVWQLRCFLDLVGIGTKNESLLLPNHPIPIRSACFYFRPYRTLAQR